MHFVLENALCFLVVFGGINLANTNKRDYYEVLGVSKSATESEIKKAYRRLAKQCHPDLHPNDAAAEAQFKEISEAYEVLSNKTKREKYDQFGHAGVDGNFGAGSSGYSSGGFDVDLGDIFESVFGGGGFGGFGGGASASRSRSGSKSPRRGQDTFSSVTISFLEACSGVSKELKIKKLDSCSKCGGSGCEPGSKPVACPNCGGTGQIRQQQRTPFGFMTSTRTCSKCGGSGTVVQNPCTACGGRGTQEKSKTIKINIPAGIDDGQTLVVSGEGNAGVYGGPSGNLNVAVSVRPDPIFKRNGFDIFCDLPITYAQAINGAEVVVPTIDGRVKYNIPEGVQPGTTFRLKGKGVKKLQAHGRGDMLVTATIEVPKNLDNNQKKLINEFDRTLTDKNYHIRKGFFEKLKGMFG